MKKSLASRIACLIAVYCAAFFILATVQFSGKGNFSLSAGSMTLKGRYSQEKISVEEDDEQALESGAQRITGGVKIFFGGLEFSLKEEREKGLLITDNDDRQTPVNPEYMTVTENTVRFGLPGGNKLVFSSFGSAKGQELHITAELAEGKEEIIIPIILRRSSLVRDDEKSFIMYGGSRYYFVNASGELENGKLVLSAERASVSYRAKEMQRAFDLEDYIIADAQNYDSILENWLASRYAHWNQSSSSLQNEDEIIAYCVESIKRGSYTAAIAAVSVNFLNSPGQSYRSSVFIGGMSGAFRSFTTAENEKLGKITSLTRERSLDLFKEEYILNYLFSHNNTALAADVISIMQNAQADMITLDYCPGIFEAFSDIRRHGSITNNPLEHLTEQALLVISENLNLDRDNDLLFAGSENDKPEYSMRLGRALIDWAQADSPWAAIGRSLVLSVLSSGGYGDGKMYNMLHQEEYYPREVSLTDPLWTWTASRSVTSSYVDGDLNIAFSFPVGLSHFVIIRGIRPFVRIQIHDMDWRTDSAFERYNSSGWVYYTQEQTLILKLRHRTQIENIRIFYRAEAPAARPVPVEPPANISGDNVDS